MLVDNLKTAATISEMYTVFTAIATLFELIAVPLMFKKKFGMTAGLPCTLEGLVGENGKVWGLESFGFSAPYKVLDEKLGFTAQNVYEQVKKLLA